MKLIQKVEYAANMRLKTIAGVFSSMKIRATDKNLLFDSKSIMNEKDTVKEKNSPKARVQRVSSDENKTLQDCTLQINYRL